MKNICKKIGKLLLTFTIAAFVAASPALAGMGGSSGGGMGGGSDSGSGGSMGGGSNNDSGGSMGGGSNNDSGGSMGGGSNNDSGGSMGGGSISDSDDRMMTEGQSHDLRSMPGISTGGLDSGNLTMEIEPVMFGNGRLEVKYYANTHTVGLGKYDLMELSTMEVDGKIYHPVEADEMSGHHSGGKIVFEIPEKPDRFRMIIQGLPGVEKRLYEWN